MSEEKIDQKGITEVLKDYDYDPSALLAILQDLQDRFGCLTLEMMRYVADAMELHVTDIFAAASFYRMFRFTPRGKHSVTFCTGTTCHVNHCRGVLDALRKDLKLKAGDTTKDGQITVEEVHCLGLCHMGPVMKVDEDYFGRLDPKMALDAIRPLKKKKAAKKPSKKGAKKGSRKGA